MKPSNILSLAFSLLISRGASQTTTAPAGSPEDVPPTRTVYSYTGTYYSGFPCAGQALAQSTASTYPDSDYTTTVTLTDVLTTSYTCCTETFVRSDATPNPPTFTSYLNTVTSTSSIVCGGCEILSLDPGNVYPVAPTYNATVTAPTTTQIEYTCTSRTLSIDTATFSGACTSIAPEPVFPSDFQQACLKTIEGLSGCPIQCVLPIFTYPQFNCYAQDISHFWDWSSQGLPKYGCQQCLPPCSDTGSSLTSDPTSTSG